MRRLIGLLLLFTLGCDAQSSANAPSKKNCPQEWRGVAEGIEFRMLDCDLFLVRVDPKRVELAGVVRRSRTARQLVEMEGLTFAINANFFDENLGPLGVVMAKGVDSRPPHPVEWHSVFYVTKDGRAGITPLGEWKNIRGEAEMAVQAGPRLVVGGERNKVKRGGPNPRSGACIEPSGKVVFFATPALLDVWQMIDLAAGPLGCRDAILFDGGPSTQLYVRGAASLTGDPRVPAYVVGKP